MIDESVDEVKPKRVRAKESTSQLAYNKLKRKYEAQQKTLNEMKAQEKFRIRSDFKNVGSSNAGRKKKYTPLKLKNRIIDYLAMMKTMNRPPTVSGLMVHLKMHRDQFYQYASYPEYREIMEQTKHIMENWLEEALILNRYNAAGITFALKNRFGWKDTTTIEHESSNDEGMLIRKLEALAPELAGFFQGNADKKLQIESNAQHYEECEVIDLHPIEETENV